MCSYAAQGLWIRLINTSFDMPTKGLFKVDHVSLSVSQILHLLPGDARTKRKGFSELVKWGVIKQGEDKAFYCKRLRDDMRLREIRRASGKLGGNPVLLGNLDKQTVNQNSNQKTTPSSSSSSSTSKYKKEKSVFEESRKLYPGTKRGCEVEFKCLKKHKDWLEVLPLLKPAIEKQIRWRQDANGEFRPCWQNLKTWLNNRSWEMELPGPPRRRTTGEILRGE